MTHWLVIFNKQFIANYLSRAMAEDYAIGRFSLSNEQAEKFKTSLVIRIPRKGLLEITCCECENGLHTEELERS